MRHALFDYIIGFILLIAVWLMVADILHLVNPLLLPTFQDVLHRLYDIVADGSLTKDLGATLYRWVIGFALGALSGTLIGLMLGVAPRLYRFLEAPIEFFRSLPVTAIFPLFLILFGIGDASKIAMAFLPTFLLMLVNASYGVHHAAPDRRRVLKIFGGNSLQRFYHVIWFEALPQIFVGLRLAFSLSLVVTVVSEMFIGTDLGMGQRIYDSYLTNSVTTLYAMLLTLGIVGYALNRLLVLIEKRCIFWAGR